MSSNQLQIQHPRTGFKFIPPKYTLGYLIIVIGTTLITSIVILSGNYSTWQADGQKIIDEEQWYRVFTGIFAVASFLDIGFMFISFLWLLFTLTEFENRYSTLFTLVHFWKVNIIIALSVSSLYYLMEAVTGMKNFLMNVGGIYPYTLHMYLKNCLQKPSQIVNHCFLPFPINRWVMGYLTSLLSMLLAPQSQGCIIIHLSYLFCSFLVLLKYLTGFQYFYREGPAIPIVFLVAQKFIPNCIQNHYGYCSMKGYYKKEEESKQQQKKQVQLNEQNQSVT